MHKHLLRTTGTILLFLLPLLGANAARHDKEREQALQFLYKYMPLPDSTDYPREFWLRNIDCSLRARKEMGWGVPQREWMHFVLPVRVNNEQLDDSRNVFYEELKHRVKGMSMKEAILEVNHWCHEYVTYQPSDARTRSPLATAKAGVGRCGEESTFTVSALRAVGIPARQVYTPRWAHTDDNHAWVEAWADGQWYFLGACEPEPILNWGWFNSAASRGMLMHTNVFGHYEGCEPVIQRNKCNTEIAVTDHYAPTAPLAVRVVDKDGRPVSATVECKLYNYAEFYSVVNIFCHENIHIFHAGLGDVMVWASNGRDYGFAMASVGKTDTLTVKLCNPFTSMDIDVVPPAESVRAVPPTAEQTVRNRERLRAEDSIRNSRPHGNDAVLDAFMQAAPDTLRARKVLDLLSSKDCGDVTLEVLWDCYHHSTDTLPSLLAQRIANENLTPYKGFLSDVLPKMDICQWAQWVRDSIKIDDSRNPKGLCMSPISVWKHRTTDHHSRDLFYIAGARALGLPAYFDAVTGRPMPDLLGQTAEAEAGTNGMLRLMPAGENEIHACYYTHFTLSRLADGRLQLMEFPENYTLQHFSQGVEMPQGKYMLVTGTRLANGSVLAHTDFFELKDEKTVTLKLRHDAEQLQVIGSLDCEMPYTDAQGRQQSILSSVGRGYYILVLTQQGHEPSNHILHDINARKDVLQATGHNMLMLDVAGNEQLAEKLVEGLHLKSSEMPLVVIADSFNRIVWMHQGYSIGMGQQLLDALKKL